MNIVFDILGEAMLDYYSHGQTATLQVKSKEMETENQSLSYFFRDWDQLPPIEKLALERCSGRVLDIGAGAGSHALILHTQEKQVIALDHSMGCVKVMRMRGLEHVIHANIFDYTEQKHETLLLLMNGIGLAGQLSELPLLLNHLKTILTPNGRIIFDSSDIIDLFREEEGSVYMNLNADYYGEVSFRYAFKGQVGPWFKWLFIDPQTLSDIAQKCGFALAIIHRDSSGHYLGELTPVTL